MESSHACPYRSLGCKDVSKDVTAGTIHAKGCPFRFFSSCFYPGCKHLSAFKSVTEYVEHVQVAHSNILAVTGNGGMRTNYWIRKDILTNEDKQSLIRLVGVIHSDKSYVDVSVAIFILLTKNKMGDRIIVPFGIILHKQEEEEDGDDGDDDDDDGRFGFALEVPIIELDFKFIGNGGLMQTESSLDNPRPFHIYPAACDSVKSVVQAFQSEKFYVHGKTILDNAIKITSEPLYTKVYFRLEVDLMVTRMSTTGLDQDGRQFAWDWGEALGPPSGWHPSVRKLLLEDRQLGLTGITRGLLSLQNEQSINNSIIVESGERHYKILLPLIIPAVNGAAKEGFRKAYRMSREPVLKFPTKQIERLSPEEYHQSLMKKATVAYSSTVIIFAGSDMLCRTLANELKVYFGRLRIVTGYEMGSKELREEAVQYGIDIMVTTGFYLNIALQPIGEYLVGSKTKLVVFLNIDRLLTERYLVDSVNFLFPQVYREFQLAKKVFVVPKLLPEHYNWIQPSEVFPLISIGRIGAMGKENLNIKVEQVWSDREKYLALSEFLASEALETDRPKRIIIFAKALRGVAALINSVRTNMIGFKYKVVTMESVKGRLADQYAREIRDFMSHDKSVFITTTTMAQSIDLPRVETVIIDGLYYNTCEFYRQTCMTNDKLFVIVNQSYAGVHHEYLRTFLEDCDKWRNE